MKKRILLVLCILVLAAALTGCGSREKNALIGRWEGQADVTALCKEALAEKLPEEMGQYVNLSPVTVTMYLEFREDDTYDLKIDGEKLFETLTLAQQEVHAGLDAYFGAAVTELGLDPTDDAVATLAEEERPEPMTEVELRNLAEELCRAGDVGGNFLAEEGRLYLTDGLALDLEEALFDDYSLVEDTLTLEAENPQTALPEGLYPMTFQRMK